MMGVLAAVKRWVTMNHEERLADTEAKCLAVMAPLKGIPGVAAEMLDNVIGHQPFGVQLDFDSTVCGMTGQEVVDRLKAGDPPIWTRVRDGEDFIVIHAFGLKDGEETVVGERIAALFK
jgi:L-seryl-tRNA(Ser) seleniumtransferase